MSQVEQNDQGTLFSVVFLENELFRMRIFNYDRFICPEIKITEVLGLETLTMPIDNFNDPFITCTFINDAQIFLNFFETSRLTQSHLIWDFMNQEKVTKIVECPLDCGITNFPVKCFYNGPSKEIYTFYKEGDAFIINSEDLESYEH